MITKLPTSFFYDEQGRLIKHINHGDIRTFVYDSSGNLQSESLYYENGELNYTRTYSYVSPTLIKVKRHNNGWDIVDNYTLTLNKEGLLIEVADDESEVLKYDYDTNNNLVRYEGYNSYNPYPKIVEYKYDTQKGWLINQGLPKWYWVYNSGTGYCEFGINRNMITRISNGESITEYLFEYDSDGYPSIGYLYNSNLDKLEKRWYYNFEVIK